MACKTAGWARPLRAEVPYKPPDQAARVHRRRDARSLTHAVGGDARVPRRNCRRQAEAARAAGAARKPLESLSSVGGARCYACARTAVPVVHPAAAASLGVPVSAP